MVTINCPRSCIHLYVMYKYYPPEKVKSVSIIPHHELYNFKNSLFKFLFPESKQKTEWTNKIFKYKYSNLPLRFKFNSNKSSLFHSTREKQAKHLYPFVYRKGSRGLLSSIFRREQDLVISARVSSFNDARGWFRRHGGTRDNTPQTFGHFHRRFPRGTGENSGGRLELPKILWASLSIVVKQLSSCQGQPFETGKSSEIFAKREGFLRPRNPFRFEIIFHRTK